MFSFCMYCFSQRCSAITISIFCIILMLTSGATMYLMYRMKEDSGGLWDVQTDPETGQDMDTMKLGVFWGIISLCSSAILTSVLGFFTANKKSCCTISFFSFLTLILTVIFLLTGGVILTVTIAANMQIDQYC